MNSLHRILFLFAESTSAEDAGCLRRLQRAGCHLRAAAVQQAFSLVRLKRDDGDGRDDRLMINELKKNSKGASNHIRKCN